MEHTYASAGVDIHKAEAFVGRLKQAALRSDHKKLWRGAGGYASVVPVSEELAVALTTDGVGTKLLVAAELDDYNTIGIDLVAMCVNDLICVGAQPMSFLDYYATPKLNDREADAIISGIISGCDQAETLLVGGETAELPDLYSEKHFDLAGFAMGTVSRAQLLTGDSITAGDVVIGVASSGIHSNGFSLARKVVPKDKWNQLLVPTRIYVRPMKKLLAAGNSGIKGAAHITGGGWRNLFRLNDNVGFVIDNPLPEPAIFEFMADQVAETELFTTFNMGMGFAVIAAAASAPAISETFVKNGMAAQQVGTVTADKGIMKVTRKGAWDSINIITISNELKK